MKWSGLAKTVGAAVTPLLAAVRPKPPRRPPDPGDFYNDRGRREEVNRRRDDARTGWLPPRPDWLRRRGPWR